MRAWNKVSSLLLKAFRAELKQEKRLSQRLSHRRWKAWGLGLVQGDTYGPHALSWHEVALAIACQFPPAPGFPIPLHFFHQALLPGSFLSSCTSFFFSRTPRVFIVPGWRLLNRNSRNDGTGSEAVEPHCIVSTPDGKKKTSHHSEHRIIKKLQNNSLSVKIPASGVLLGQKAWWER